MKGNVSLTAIDWDACVERAYATRFEESTWADMLAARCTYTEFSSFSTCSIRTRTNYADLAYTARSIN